MKQEIISEPSVEQGLGYILEFNSFLMRIKNIEGVMSLVFGEKEKDIGSIFSYENAGSYFLNLDPINQVQFLKHALVNVDVLSFADIPNYKKVGEKCGITDWNHFNQEDVRQLAVAFGEISEWEAYPHALIWIKRWCLYSLNNSIEDVNWNGDKYGTLVNWINYFESIDTQEKINIVKFLINYY